jgi:hypothetical protein
MIVAALPNHSAQRYVKNVEVKRYELVRGYAFFKFFLTKLLFHADYLATLSVL